MAGYACFSAIQKFDLNVQQRGFYALATLSHVWASHVIRGQRRVVFVINVGVSEFALRMDRISAAVELPILLRVRRAKNWCQL